MAVTNESSIFEELPRLKGTSVSFTGEEPAAAQQPMWLNGEHRVRAGKVMAVRSVSLKEFVSGELALIPEVEAVLAARHGNVMHIWTVVNSSEPELRRRIYEREKSVIDGFPDFEFDFSMITRRDRDVTALASKAGVELTFRRG